MWRWEGSEQGGGRVRVVCGHLSPTHTHLVRGGVAQHGLDGAEEAGAHHGVMLGEDLGRDEEREGVGLA